MKPEHSRSRGIWPWLVLGILLHSCGSSTSPEASAPPNIVFVSIDSLRPDHLGCYGYDKPTSPFLDGLAAGGARFENAVSTTSWTLPSHASMFTGLLGKTHGLVDNGMSLSEDQVTLAELLKGQGYHTAGFFGGPYLHPTFGLHQGFDVYESCMSQSFDGLSGDEVRNVEMSAAPPSHTDITGPRTQKRVEDWARERVEEGASDPYFLFLHLWDVHYNFNPPDEFREMFVDPNYNGPADGRLMHNKAIRPGMAQSDLDHVLALYDGEIRFTDEILKRIFRDLTDKGMMKNTLVLITADHGEEFFEHNNVGHNKTLFDEVLRIPMIAHWPGHIEAGQVIEDQVQIVDLMPTFASFAGFNGSLPSQGADISPLLAGRKMKPRDALSGLFIDGMSLRALRSNDRKVLRIQDDQPAVYVNLRKFPGEDFEGMIYPDTPRGQKRRLAGQTELEEALRRSAQYKDLLGRRAPNTIEIHPELESELEKLGYFGTEEDDAEENPE